MFSIEICIRDQISLMEDKNEKEWIESVCDKEKFSLSYNSIADINPNSGEDIEKFW